MIMAKPSHRKAKFNVYKGIIKGLQEALAYQRGELIRCRVTVREIPLSGYNAVDGDMKGIEPVQAGTGKCTLHFPSDS